MYPSQKVSVAAAVFTSVLLIADGALVLYACLLWPREDAGLGSPLFVVGVATFVVCFSLPFVLIGGFVVSCQQQ